MKKILFLFIVLTLSSCSYGVGDVNIDTITDNTANGKVLKISYQNKVRNDPVVIKKIEDTINTSIKLLDPDNYNKLISEGYDIERYLSELKIQKRNIDETCLLLKEKGDFSSQEIGVIDTQCKAGIEEISKIINNINESYNKCSFSINNPFVIENLNLLKEGLYFEESFYVDYQKRSKEYIRKEMLNIEDPLLVDFQFKCLDTFVEDFYKFISIDFKRDILLPYADINNLNQKNDFFDILIKDNNYLETKKSFQKSFIDNHSDKFAPIYILNEEGKCDTLCQKDTHNIYFKYVIPDIVEFFRYDKKNDIPLLTILRDGSICYEGSSCYIYIKGKLESIEDITDITFLKQGTILQKIESEIYKKNNNIYEIIINKEALEVLFNNKSNIYIGISRINNNVYNSNNIRLFKNNINDDNSLTINNKTIGGVKIPIVGKKVGNKGGEINGKVNLSNSTESSINFSSDTKKPNNIDFTKTFGITGGVGLEASYKGESDKLNSSGGASIEAHVEGGVESKRIYGYDYNDNKNDIKNKTLFINTFLDDLNIGDYGITTILNTRSSIIVDSLSEERFLSKSQKEFYIDWYNSLDHNSRRGVNLNYYSFEGDDVTFEEKLNYAKLAHPVGSALCVGEFFKEGENNCALCSGTLFSNYPLLRSLGCGGKLGGGGNIEGSFDTPIVSGNGGINGSIGGNINKFYSKVDKKIEKRISSYSLESSMSAGFNTPLDIIPEIINIITKFNSSDSFIDDIDSFIDDTESWANSMSFWKNNFLSKTIQIYKNGELNGIEQIYVSDINQKKDYNINKEYNLQAKFLFKTGSLNVDDFEQITKNKFNNYIHNTLNNDYNFINSNLDLSNAVCGGKEYIYDIELSILQKNVEYNNTDSFQDYATLLETFKFSIDDEGDKKDIKKISNNLKETFKKRIVPIEKDIKFKNKNGESIKFTKGTDISLLEAFKGCNYFNKKQNNLKNKTGILDCTKIKSDIAQIVKDSGLLTNVYSLIEKNKIKKKKDKNFSKIIDAIQFEKSKEYEIEIPIASYTCDSGNLYVNYIRDNISFEENDEKINVLFGQIKETIIKDLNTLMKNSKVKQIISTYKSNN